MKKERDRSIDLLKTFLVIGMILCHCFQLIGQSNKISDIISMFINLITFSGFLFCFGYAVSIAYLNKDKKDVTRKILKNCFELIIVFYLSSIAHEILITKDFTLIKLLKILVLSEIPGHSEFLAGFFVLNILTSIFFNQLKRLVKSNKYIIIFTVVASLLLTFIPYQYIKINQIGLIIGSTQFYCFPIIQYLGYYILGIVFNQYRIKFNVKFFIISMSCTIIFILYSKLLGIPSRFPPSMFWIIGGIGLIYVYYLISIYLSSKIDKNSKIYFIGENTLYFLLGSNVILFLLSGIYNIKLNFISNIIATILIILLCYMIIYIIKSSRKQYNITKIYI